MLTFAVVQCVLSILAHHDWPVNNRCCMDSLAHRTQYHLTYSMSDVNFKTDPSLVVQGGQSKCWKRCDARLTDSQTCK